MPQTRPLEGLERLTLALLIGFVASLQLSIAMANILGAATLVAWVAILVRDRVRPTAPRFFLPLAAYGIATLVSAAFSLNPAASFFDSRQLILFAIIPAVYDIARGNRATLVVDVIISVGAASAAFGIIQYGILHYDNLGQRPQGALTHYMTYSGLLMLVIAAATARVVFAPRERAWAALVMPALAVALVLTFTRSAWIGACAAVGLLLVMKDFRLTAILPVAVAVLFALAPDRITDRMVSVFDLQAPTNRDRMAMARTGGAIVADYPLTGVGPNMIPEVYEQYRDPAAVEATNLHLHNVPLQIAAERGLPAVAVWIWFLVALALATYRLFQEREHRTLAAGALAAVAAMLAAGLFEYNFGDSEFLMLFLVLVTLPFAAARGDGDPSPDRS